MTIAALSLELDMLLTRGEENELTTIVECDPFIDKLEFEVRRGCREFLHIELADSRIHGSDVPQTVRQFLYGANIGYTSIRHRQAA